MNDNQIILFHKMHALGNDFMLIDATQQSVNSDRLPVRAWGDRHTGVGFDQLLLLMPSSVADVKCRIFNSDGSEAEQCGNGMRCVALYLAEQEKIPTKTTTIETAGGLVQAEVLSGQEVQVSMGVPVLTPGWMDLTIPSLKKPVRVFALSMGNPHAILEVESLADCPVEVIGREISTDPSFPKGVNVGFMQIRDQHHLLLRTYERGAGLTLACGSNACAAAVTAILHCSVSSPVNIASQLGSLQLNWHKKNMASVKMTGTVAFVYGGEINFR